MAIGRNAAGARSGLLLCAVLCSWWGCMQPDSGSHLAGSGTELGNVMGMLLTPEGKAAAGVEVSLYPLADSGRTLKTTTNADGRFAFTVENGAFRLLALDGKGNGITVDSLQPSLRDTIDLEEAYLTPLGGIRGFVKAHAFQQNSTQLQLVGAPFDTSYPGNAEFVWEGIPAGKYWLDAYEINGITIGIEKQVLVTVVSGAVTALPDTIDLATTVLDLTSQLPYQMFEPVRPAANLDPDSVYWMLNGRRIENEGTDPHMGELNLTEAMLDSAGINFLQLFAHSGDSIIVVSNWKITWQRSASPKWAYQAVRAVIVSIRPDTRPSALRPGAGGGNPQLGTFRVLEKRRLSREALQYWEWPAQAGGDSTAPAEIQAAIYDPQSMDPRGCMGLPPAMNPSPHFPGDTVTFFLLPDSVLDAVAFRLRTDERFQDMDHVGYYARADWPLGKTFGLFRKLDELRTSLRPEGFRIDWAWTFMFRESESRCQSTFRRFLVDSSGRTRETLACPPGIDSSRLLLHYRAGFTNGIDADTLPTTGSYVYVDSTGSAVFGHADSTRQDSARQIRLEAGALQELETLLAGYPNPFPAEWHTDYETLVWPPGLKDSTRYLISNGNGVLYIPAAPGVSADKADLFVRLEIWLRSQNLL